MKSILEINGLLKAFNKNEAPVVNAINLTVEEGDILAVVGESGSGKTTLARLISGLETPNEGVIKLNNIIIANATVFKAPEKRKIGMVFQDYALFPHLTVLENVGYGLSKKITKTEKSQCIETILKRVGLQGFNSRFPHQLSGGQQQRVALARALAPDPALLILDEPFSNLDANLRVKLRNDIFNIIKKTKVTALFVTHDTQDAIAIADKIIVLKEGKIQQEGTPEILYNKPNSKYVASLFSTIATLHPEDLDCFGYKTETNKNYALRVEDFEINKQNDYTAQAKVIKSQFIGRGFFNTVSLANNVVITITSTNQIKNQITVGFSSSKLLTFS